MNMTLDELKAFGIVVSTISDSELGNKWIACVGKRGPGGIHADDGQYWMADTDMEAAMQCYNEADNLKRPD
jgi:hypothetical protein